MNMVPNLPLQESADIRHNIAQFCQAPKPHRRILAYRREPEKRVGTLLCARFTTWTFLISTKPCYRSLARLIVGNLFAWRATDAAELKKTSDPIGPDNDASLAEIITAASVIICAWGNGGTYLARNERVLRMIRDFGRKPHCLRLTKQGHPSHPLYLPAALRPAEMRRRSP
jgi:hypothetical protein